MELSPTEIFNGRKIFLLGSTGFLGKVCLSMLLYRFPNVGRIYVMVRAGSEADSAIRFWDIFHSSPVFNPLRARYGSALEGFVRDKVVVVGGDIGEPNLGYTPEFAEQLAQDIDIVINSSGNVTFNPKLDAALRTNVIGTQNVIAFAKRMKRPALIHVSTCFVAGNRSGAVWENDPVVGYFPRQQELEDTSFSVARELRDCEGLARRVREEADDVVITARFRADARQRLIEEGRDPDDERTLQTAIARERKVWIRQRLTDLGIERAQWWGWPNIYTYTKSLGEQLVAAEQGIARAIVRPSIVESAVAFPFPGWNEGFTTTAPLIFLALKGQTKFPVEDKLILDIIPVDYIAASILAIAAQTFVEQPQLVYQLSTGDVNPNRMQRIVTLLGLYKRKHFQEKDSGNKWLNEFMARMEARTVTYEHFDKTSLPMFNKAAQKVSSLLDRVRPRWGGGKVTELIDQVKESVERVEKFTKETSESFELFRPFMSDNQYVFRADHIRNLIARFPEAERTLLPWQPAALDWYNYWLEVHIPGLEKWVFPTFEEDLEEKPKRVYTYRDLIELFETTTKRHAPRIAMCIEKDGVEERYTYADLRELAMRVAAFLVSQGIAPGDRVLLLSDNCPEWGMCYFGVIRAGAICIPIDAKSSIDEVVNLTRSGGARGIIISDELSRKLDGLAERLWGNGLSTSIWPYREVFTLEDEEVEQQRIAKLPTRISTNALASLIFTSGTTGIPKGVMLSHRNFTSLVAKLSAVFDLNERDGMLSVLPMHHTFEFSAGFLMPLSVGAQITYLPELTGDALSQALKHNHVTAIVGVPALWELLHRRIMNRFAEKSEWLERTMKALMRINSRVREKTPLNLGPLIFYPVHERLGGRIRYLISGGSALSENVLKGFHGLGFTLLEGYGLTEAAPVLTVNRPSNRMLAGSVGKPLPGIDVMIMNADERGVGEVVARGPNVMLGYYENEDATQNVLVDKWLHTGDLGRVDKDGNLYLVGRLKDVIVDNNGKNIYPDEIEELYGQCEFIKELSVVGLPDGVAERVSCLVVPDYERDTALAREEVRLRIEEHFRNISITLPFHKRVKVLQFTDIELPRTATRKVKRREVIDTLQRLQRLVRTATSARETGMDSDLGWLLDVVASVSGKPRASITLTTRLDELGFDSLMYTELGVSLEAAGATFPSADVLSGVTDVRELARMVRRHQLTRREQPEPKVETEAKTDEIHIPPAVAEVGRQALDLGQRLLYEKILKSNFRGRTNIPPHTNFIVAANHSSHLDMGLAKTALGDAGKELVALAAADYFFDNKYKRAYFENFTNLVPMDRSGSLRKSLRWAGHYLEQGFNVLIFPEGTRSISGEIQEFKATLGYLALHYHIGILPIYLFGTFEAFPKGSLLLKGREVGATIGPFLSPEDIERMAVGLPKSEAYRFIAATVRYMVLRMRDGLDCRIDIEQMRQRWRLESMNAEMVEST
ncbi:MAG: AMP-binding protein [Acidobacteriota bacterium]